MKIIRWVIVLFFASIVVRALFSLVYKLVSHSSFDSSDVAVALFGLVAAWLCRNAFKALSGSSPVTSNVDLKLSWPRFVFLCALMAIAPTLIVASNMSNKDSWPATLGMSIVFVSMLVFSALGWARLRKANASGHIARSDRAQIFRHLIGPVAPAIIWSLLTILAPIVLVFVWLLHSHAA